MNSSSSACNRSYASCDSQVSDDTEDPLCKYIGWRNLQMSQTYQGSKSAQLNVSPAIAASYSAGYAARHFGMSTTNARSRVTSVYVCTIRLPAGTGTSADPT